MRKLLLIVLALVLPGCDLPHDPEKTSERARGGTIEVGVVDDHAPWAYLEGGVPRGIESELVRRFARELGPGTEIRWIPGSEEMLFRALEHYDLDLVIGGITDASPWRERVAFTTPYATTRWMVGAPAAAPPVELSTIDQLAGRKVYVARGSPAVEMLEAKGAQPVELDNPAMADELLAAEGWQLNAWGFDLIPGITLDKDKRVLAVPPGENGWLVHLEKFLYRNVAEIQPLIDRETTQ